MSPKNRFPVAFPITPTRSTRGQDPKTPSSAFTPSQRQRRLEHIIAGMAESPQRRANTGVPHSPVSHDWHDVVPELSYAATSRSGRQFSGTTSLQGPSNYDQYDGTSLPSPSPSKRSRYSEIGSLYSVGIQTSPRPQSLLDDGSEHAVEVELEFAPDNSFGSVAGTSRDRLPAAFPLPGTSTLRASPSHHRESMMPGDRSQGYLTPPKSSELHSDERPLSRQGSFAPAGSPAQQNGNGRKAGARPHPQWQFEEDTENPFHDPSHASLLQKSPTDSAHALDSPLVNYAQSQVGEEGVLPPLSDRVAVQLTGMNTVPGQIRKLERQLKAAHNSISARDRKIQEMREDIHRLEATVEGLRATR
ncbi:hypothetical protein FOMPIDRAFT_97621 [Fomitopsis schrenkii]|uniref:Uncharacterized protein n=1 Tax=Fomitopsis schrenkii TaxID=2126942 RepID=S8EPN9_FOMSC|nr:hypothetical protein FOMPIDRAFT_97621 [Fomitopsis schrenkii]